MALVMIVLGMLLMCAEIWLPPLLDWWMIRNDRKPNSK